MADLVKDNQALKVQYNKMAAAVRKMHSKVESLGDIKAQLDLIKASSRDLTFREKMIEEAEKVIPYTNVIEITLANTTARTTQSLTVSQEGWFFIDRIYASFRPTAGAQLGRWRPVSSGNATVAGAELQAAGLTVGLLNFYWEYAEGRAQRTRQNLPVPGDILYRSDNDGFVAPGLGDGIGPNATVTFHITPSVAPGVAGVCVISLVGIQCLGVLKQ